MIPRIALNAHGIPRSVRSPLSSTFALRGDMPRSIVPVYLRVHHAAFDRSSWPPCVAVGVAGVGR